MLQNLHLAFLKNSKRLNLRILTPTLFWYFMQPYYLKFFLNKHQFFFKFFEKKHYIKKRVPRFPRYYYGMIKCQPNRILKKFKVAKWFAIPVKTNRRFAKFSKKHIVFKYWKKKYFMKLKQFRVRRNFLRFLKQKIMVSQLAIGSFLFSTNKVTFLKKLFKIFRTMNNSSVVFSFFFKKIFLKYFLKGVWGKYKNFIFFFNIQKKNKFSPLHLNLLKTMLFISKKKSEIKKKNKILMSKKRYWMSKKKKTKTNERKLYFNNFYQKVLVRTYFIEYSCLTNYCFNNVGHLKSDIYYLSFFLNTWNIRSYNWKQVT